MQGRLLVTSEACFTCHKIPSYYAIMTDERRSEKNTIEMQECIFLLVVSHEYEGFNMLVKEIRYENSYKDP